METVGDPAGVPVAKDRSPGGAKRCWVHPELHGSAAGGGQIIAIVCQGGDIHLGGRPVEYEAIIAELYGRGGPGVCTARVTADGAVLTGAGAVGVVGDGCSAAIIHGVPGDKGTVAAQRGSEYICFYLRRAADDVPGFYLIDVTDDWLRQIGLYTNAEGLFVGEDETAYRRLIFPIDIKYGVPGTVVKADRDVGPLVEGHRNACARPGTGVTNLDRIIRGDANGKGETGGGAFGDHCMKGVIVWVGNKGPEFDCEITAWIDGVYAGGDIVGARKVQ